jgi:hypothetical protein
VDALSGKVFPGRVQKIGLLPDAMSRWMNPDLKVFDADIYLDGDAGELRPGMTCMTEIIVQEIPDTLYVPIQCVLRAPEGPVVYVMTPKGPARRSVQVGMDNNRMVQVLEGVVEGEQVLLNPPLEAGTVAELPAGAAPTQPASQPTTDEAPPFDPSEFLNLTPEERREKMNSLTPEQREKLREQFGGTRFSGDRGGRPGGGRSGGSQPAQPPEGETP